MWRVWKRSCLLPSRRTSPSRRPWLLQRTRYTVNMTCLCPLLSSSSLAFPFRVRSPVWLFIFFLHVGLFITSTALRPTVFMSLLWRLSTWSLVVVSLFFLTCLSSVLFTFCSSCILITCTRHFSHISIIVLDACVTLIVPIIYSFLVFRCYSTHPSRHPHLPFHPCFLSFCC